jgi:hypothetical protein
MRTWQAPQDTAAEDNAVEFCAELGMNADAAREAVCALAHATGFGPGSLREWCSADAPGAPEDLPALYYAALLPFTADDNMPLGLGDSPAAALVDLLWALGGPLLLTQLRANDPEPELKVEPAPAPESSTACPLTQAR